MHSKRVNSDVWRFQSALECLTSINNWWRSETSTARVLYNRTASQLSKMLSPLKWTDEFRNKFSRSMLEKSLTEKTIAVVWLLCKKPWTTFPKFFDFEILMKARNFMLYWVFDYRLVPNCYNTNKAAEALEKIFVPTLSVESLRKKRY